jgi:hypothetical protein
VLAGEGEAAVVEAEQLALLVFSHEARWSSLVARRANNSKVAKYDVRVSISYQPLAPAERCQIQLLGFLAGHLPP